MFICVFTNDKCYWYKSEKSDIICYKHGANKDNKIRIIDIDLLLLHLFKMATASLSNIFSCSKALMATIRLNKLINTSKLIYSIFGECIKQLTIASISEMVSTKSFLKIRIS